MTMSSIAAVSEKQFEQRHNHQSEGRGKSDIFLAWFALMFVAVIGAHFLLNMASNSPTGYVTAEQNPLENMTILANAFFVLFITVLVGILGHWGITRNDY